MTPKNADLDAKLKQLSEICAQNSLASRREQERFPIEKVDIEALLDSAKDNLDAHLVLPKGASTVMPLFGVGTFCFERFDAFPRLLITSIDPESGKSKAMKFVKQMCFKPISCGNISSSSLFRTIDGEEGTLFIDEADEHMASSGDMASIINCGAFKEDAYFMRTDRFSNDVKAHYVYKPIVVVGNGTGMLSPASLTRCIKIQMEPKQQFHKIKEIRDKDIPELFGDTREKIATWVDSVSHRFDSEYLEPKYIGSYRLLDLWGPLFTIARLVSDKWLGYCEEAYSALAESNLTTNMNQLLIRDIRKVFSATGKNRISSQELVGELLKMIEQPWPSSNKGRAMTAHSLASQLKKLGIKSSDYKFDGSTLRGYELDVFADAFARYCK